MAESGWSALFAASLSNGILGASSSLLAVRSDEDGKQVKISAGQYHIRGHVYTLNAEKILPVPANTSGSNRRDFVVIRLDVANRRIVPDILTGAPALTQVIGGVWEEAIAEYTVISGFTSIPSTSVLDRRAWADKPEALGTFKAIGGTVVPYNYLSCDGSAKSRTVYSELFSVIGTTYGAGDGSTTFNIPLLTGSFLSGRGGTRGSGQGGMDQINLTTPQLPSHGHTINDPQHKHNADGDGGNRWIVTGGSNYWLPATFPGGSAQVVTITDIDPASTGITINNTGNGDPVTIVPKYSTGLFIIKAR